MKIIHIASYFEFNSVYTSLFNELEKQNLKQEVLIASKSQIEYEPKINHFKLVFANCLNVFTKLIFAFRILSMWIVFKKYFESNRFDIIHAHTLYADGVFGLLMAQACKKKLVITVRGSDVNIFFKYRWHYKFLIRRLLKKCKERGELRLIFLSKPQKNRFLDYFGIDFSTVAEVIPNGIDSYFCENVKQRRITPLGLSILRPIFVGKMNRNKNLENTIKALESFNEKNDHMVILTIVGVNEAEFKQVFPNWKPTIELTFCGKVCKERLLELYNNSHFLIVPSYYETFGLVYIEAISQCLPVIHSEGQGISGYFAQGEVGFECLPDSVTSIYLCCEDVLSTFPQGLAFQSNPSTQFSWKSSGVKHNEVYR